jgi:iron-sulfur cluster repair protein YtfE (RIC family)
MPTKTKFPAKKDPFAILKKDHRKVEKIFSQLMKTTDRGEKNREELFSQLKTALDNHTQIEETILYPAIRAAAKTHDIALEAYEEHHQAKMMLAELADLPVTAEEWMAKLSVLKEDIEHHVEEEEAEMFPKTKKALGAKAVDELGMQIAQAMEDAEAGIMGKKDSSKKDSSESEATNSKEDTEGTA